MKRTLIALAVASSLFAATAQAVTFAGASGSPSNIVTDYSADTLLSFDLDLHDNTPVTLGFTLDAADVAAGELGFNALLRNLSGLAFPNLVVSLTGVSFGPTPGTITTDGFAAVSSTTWTSQLAAAAFTPGLASEAYFGNPLQTVGATDWTISLAGRQAGDSFSLVVAVPEPEAWLAMVLGIGGATLLARRRRNTVL